MKKLTDNWAEPFRSLVHKLPEDIEARSIRIEDWLFRPGRANVHPRAVLLGDSAHTMTMCTSVSISISRLSNYDEVRGEGANNAVQDVQNLVKRVDMQNPEYVLLTSSESPGMLTTVDRLTLISFPPR
jgi:hypothetical protein